MSYYNKWLKNIEIKSQHFFIDAGFFFNNLRKDLDYFCEQDAYVGLTYVYVLIAYIPVTLLEVKNIYGKSVLLFSLVVIFLLGSWVHRVLLSTTKLFAFISYYFCLLLLSIVFFFFLYFSTNFLVYYGAIEGLSLITLFLLARNIITVSVKELFLKYFCFSTFSAIFMLTSFCFVYPISYSFDFLTIKLLIFNFKLLFISSSFSLTGLNLSMLIILSVSFWFFVLSFLFKLGLFPFHILLPDIYATTSLIFILYYNCILKIIYLISFFQVILGVFSDLLYISSNIFIVVGCLSMLVGSLSALGQLNIWRLLGYASTVQMGLVFIALSNVTYMNIFLIIGFIYIYLCTLFLFFISINLYRYHTGSEYPTSQSYATLINTYVNDTNVNAYLVAIVCFVICFLSNAALPPFIGFFAKYSILLTIFSKECLLIIFIIAILNIITTFYYIKVLLIYLDQFRYLKYINTFVIMSNGWYLRRGGVCAVNALSFAIMFFTKVSYVVSMLYTLLFLMMPLIYLGLLDDFYTLILRLLML